MSLASTKIKLKKAFGLVDTKSAITYLERNLSDKSLHLDTFINLKRSYNDLKQREMQNRIAYEELSRNTSDITHSFLSLIEMLEVEDLVGTADNPIKKVGLKLLFLTPNADNIPVFKSFFTTFSFTNVDFRLLTDSPILNYDIIIFDNQDLPAENSRSLSEIQRSAIQERSQLMNQILKTSERSYIIHLGNTLFWLNNHRNRCNAANSKFTLHSNIKNLIEFIESYQA